AGAVYPTADVVRTAMQLIGKHPDYGFVSSFFIMLLQQEFHPVQGAMVFADCALVVNPDENQLADIAIMTGESTKQLLGMQPEIAMLSFSTNGSAKHKMVTKVASATQIAQSLRPDWRIIGDVQLDAAVIPEILGAKAPDMATDKPVNVLVFPDLNAGNIGYKLVERFGAADAIGPVLQGLAKPVNDLSRGCSDSDIFNIMAVTGVQARAGS
ncbi:MAG: phosphate acetyltransferase, partial [Gammaproteobacteria bacterium]|nr:phosphate acetyltransferase [Gammaproteobacteria bacterium]